MTSYATLRDNANSVEDGLTPTTTPLSPPPSLELATSVTSESNACVMKMNTPSKPASCDPDSFSESEREKMDSTPENLKKIDDVINEAAAAATRLHHQQKPSLTTVHPHHHQYNTINSLSTPPSLSPRSEQCSSFGLAAAVDDSNAKFCLTKPLCNIPKEMIASSKSVNKEITRDNKNDDEETSTGSLRQSTTLTAAKADGCSSEKEARVTNDQYGRDDDESTSSNGNTTAMTASMKQQSCSFTIDNFNEKERDAAAQAAKYKNMMERFQSRHRRGASMSKLENENDSSSSATQAQTPTRLTSSQSSTPLTSRSSIRSSFVNEDNNANSLDSETTTQKVKLRVRDRSTSRVRDASKRHSWSPRSNTNENHLQSPQSATSTAAKSTTVSARKTTKTVNKPPPIQVPKGSSNLMANRTQFTPRSTAMQMALKQVDFLCPQPPLTDFKHLNADADDVSEAGTYTLDGDNYTEEQKDLMNIDRNGKPILENTRRTKSRPKQLDAGMSNPRQQSMRSNNVLEVNYYHDSEALDPRTIAGNTSTSDLIMGSHQSAGAYLEKIKSRVLRNMNATKQMDMTKQESLKSKLSPTADDDEDVDPDLGCFTSVTTSGVLAKQRTLAARPKLSRHSGLSTSQIDSSEYVSNETKLKSSGTPASLAGGFTDLQKAEYRLNVFTNQKEASQKFAATRNLIETPPETPTGPQPTSKLSEVAVLQTAQTKHDWIQEWARNARARSLANDRHCTVGVKQANQDMLMTRSYTCADTGNDSLTDDSLYSAQSKQFNAKLNRTLAERYRLQGGGDCDYASDPSLATSTSYNKPPKSPTKIPSPLHSLGRTRSASRTRASLQNMMLPADDEDYLQQTADAINNLQQNLSRKNSLKSPSHSASPRTPSARSHVPYSAEGTGTDCSPQHSLNAQRQRKTEQNLMTSSINEQQLQMLTSGEYLLRQMRMRKNSFDGHLAGSGSPHRRVLHGGAPPQIQSPTTPTTVQEQSLSPLRRSSSFSARVAATQRAARPNFQNIYTPPAARHSYGLSVAPQQQSQLQSAAQSIKKSASSSNFGHAYSDYDDNLQYYINDEDDQDDLGEEYYSSGAEDNYDERPDEMAPENSVPLSNTRYNKALLMRIERSKQKVSGKPQSAPATRSAALAAAAAAGGVMACPNTPELPRRNVKSATTRSSVTTSQRQSMPRDTSLSRLAQQVPNSLASAKKQLLQTAANVPSNNTQQRSTSSQRAQPRYLDISKYKPSQSNQFLRKNDAKSTLKPSSNDIMKRSPSSSSMGLSRTDPSRASNRSVRSATSVMTTSGTSLGGGTGRASSAVRRDASVTKQKETEMAMWKRRSKYDPMKAAAEDRRKKEEAKRLVQTQQLGVVGMPSERQSRSLYRRGQL